MFSFLTTLYDIYSSSNSRFQRKKIQENWQPLIKELKEMAEAMQGQYNQLAAEKKSETKIEAGKDCGLCLISKKPTEEEHKKLAANTIYLYEDEYKKLKYVVKGSQQEHDMGDLDKDTIAIIQPLLSKKPLQKEVLYDSSKLLELLDNNQQKALQSFFNLTSKRGHTPSRFIRNIHEILEQIEKLPKSVDYELHHAVNEKAGVAFLKLKSSQNAIVIVQEDKKQYAYIKNPSSGKIIKQLTTESIELPALTKTEPVKKVMIINERNLHKIDKLIEHVLDKASIKPPDTDWKVLTKLLEKIPSLIAAFDELNLHSTLGKKLSEFKQKLDPQKIIKDLLFTGYDLALMSGIPAEPKPQTIYLSANPKGLIYTVIGEDKKPENGIILWKNLPKDFPKTEIEILSAKNKLLPDILQQTAKAYHTPPPTLYEKITREMGKWLDEEHFKGLPPDQQAMTLSFMELYNEALKQTHLRLRETEQKMRLKPGSLANVTVIEGKSLNKLCEEFNEVYQRSMATAGYKVSIELYPFTQSLTPESAVSTSSQPDTKVEKSATEVKTITDLYTYTQKTLRERYRQLKKLKTDMAAPASQQESLAQRDKATQDMTAKAKEFLVAAETELKKALDETIYARYFVESSLDRFYEKEQQKHWIKQGEKWVEKDKHGFIRDAGQAFIQLKKIIAQIETLQKATLTKDELTTPAARLAERAAKLNALAKAGIELIASLNQMRNDPYLRKLITIPDDFLGTLAPLKKLSQESIVSRFQSSIQQSTNSLATIIEEIEKKLLSKLISEKASSLTIPAFNTLKKASNLAEQLKKLAATKKAVGEKVSLLSFAAKNFSTIRIILTELPQVIELFSHLSKYEITRTAEAINDAMKQLVLLGDKLEIQLGLKEGYLTSQLEPALRGFNTKILELGYRFPKEQTYPYQEALTTQRKNLLGGQEMSPLQKELIKQHLRLTQEKEIKLTEKKPLDQEEKNQALTKEISDYIGKLRLLEPEKLTKTIELLELLIQEKSASSFDLAQSWKQLKIEHPKHFSLLLKGEVGALLKKLEYKAQNISQEDIFNSLQRELAALKKQRGSYFTQSARRLEEKISAWENLHDLLKTHNLSDALDKLTPAQLDIVKKNEHGLLEKIKIMNDALHAEAHLTTLISSSPAKPDVPVSAPEDKKNEIIAMIDIQLEKLAKNEKKATLLGELKGHLKDLSLDAAIKKIKINHPDDSHLLFQGRVGEMMKSIESVTLTKEALIKRIDYELDILLQKQHASHFIFFAQTRTETLEKQIESLKTLKTALTDKNSGKTAREAIKSLTDQTKKILQRHEPDLLKKIEADSPITSRQRKAA